MDMSASTDGQSRRLPDRLDATFGLVAGLYVAMLLVPSIPFVAVIWLDLGVGAVALGVVGVVIAAVVGWSVTRWGEILEWLDSPLAEVALPSLGALTVLGFLGPGALYLAARIGNLPSSGLSGPIALSGLACGFGAVFLGIGLVSMARSRLVRLTVPAEHNSTWTAGWPLKRRLWSLAVGILGVVVVLAPAVVRWQASPLWPLVLLALSLLVVLITLGSETEYRGTPAGLVVRSSLSARLFDWAQFDGFSVTDDAIVLHRPFPFPDIRFARASIERESDVIATIEEQLDRAGDGP